MNLLLNKYLSVVVLCVILGNFEVVLSQEEKWSYEDQDQWGGSCNVGHRQSPINIPETLLTDHARIPAIEIQNFDKAVVTTVTNNGHSVQVNIPGEVKPTLSGAGLNGTYNFENLHFHWPSDHTVNKESFDLEAHFVFYSSEYASIAEASKHADGIAVIGIFYNEILTSGPAIFDILAAAAEEVSQRVNSVTRTEPIKFQDLLPRDPNPFYKYMGSLTTPECDEAVTWIILGNIGKINIYQYESLTTIYGSDHQLLSFTNRNIQPRNKRRIYYKGY